MYAQILESPIGPLYLTATDQALTGCRRLQRLDDALEIRPGEVTRLAAGQLRDYFSGTRRELEVPLLLRGTPFQRAVWESLRQVRFGQSLTYGQLARQVERPGAARAVGSAVGANALLLFVPCHRVLVADGHLGGFSAGLDAKRTLLRLEGIPWQL